MDWGATIVFVLSIIGAVMLSDGDLVVGIIAFLVIFCILAVIKSVVEFTASSDTTNSTPKKETPQKTGKTHIVFTENSLELTLDMVMRFLDAYSTENPGEWYHLFISHILERCDVEYCDNVTYGRIKIQILLGGWWDSLLRSYPDIVDYMKSFFTFESDDAGCFTLTSTHILTGESVDCKFPVEIVDALLQRNLDNYEAKHPSVKFERESWGAKISNI